jgi:hypothetical protein
LQSGSRPFGIIPTRGIWCGFSRLLGYIASNYVDFTVFANDSPRPEGIYPAFQSKKANADVRGSRRNFGFVPAKLGLVYRTCQPVKPFVRKMRLFQNFSFGTATLKFVVLQG